MTPRRTVLDQQETGLVRAIIDDDDHFSIEVCIAGEKWARATVNDAKLAAEFVRDLAAAWGFAANVHWRGRNGSGSL